MASPFLLSLSTVAALIGVVLVAVAFGTNNWQKYTVRSDLLPTIENDQMIKKEVLDYIGIADLNKTDLLFNRNFGLFSECFPSNRIPNLDTQLSPLGETCIGRGNDYQIPQDYTVTSAYDDNQTTRMHLMRTQVGFYITGLAMLVIALVCGMIGCWRQSGSLILITGVLLLFATLFLAGAMAVWHGVDYLSRQVIQAKYYYQSWPEVIRRLTTIDYGWSYMLAWIGIGFILIASVLMLVAYRAIKEEHYGQLRKDAAFMIPGGYYDKQTLASMPSYGYGYGYSGYPAYYSASSYGSGYNPYAVGSGGVAGTNYLTYGSGK